MLFRLSSAAEKSDKIEPFISVDAGIGLSNSFLKPDSILQYKVYASYSLDVQAGFQKGNFLFSSGIGVQTFSHRLAIVTFDPFNPNDNAVITDGYVRFENLYLNIPMTFSYRKQNAKKIYPIVEGGLAHLFFIGQGFNVSKSVSSNYLKSDFTKVSDMPDYFRRYSLAGFVNVGLGIPLKHGFSYDIALNYTQHFFATTKNPGLISYIKEFPYSFGLKTGFNYHFKRKTP
ncbi:MAG TPA: hypothetical protein PKX72_02825 [Chitinophagales bacterium]|nr:hypothetical protein [Chitinophagales bacterium]